MTDAWDPCGREHTLCSLVGQEPGIHDGLRSLADSDRPALIRDSTTRSKAARRRRQSTSSDLQDLLSSIVRSACELTTARYGALGVVGPSGGLVDFVTEGLTVEQRSQMGHLPRGRGLLGHLLTHPGPMRIDDLACHSASSGFPPGHPLMTSFLGTPVRVRSRVFGNLYLTNKAGAEQFSESDEDALVVLAALAGTAIEQAYRREALEREIRWVKETARLGVDLWTGDPAVGCSAALVAHADAAADASGVLLVAISGATPPGVSVRERTGSVASGLEAALPPIVRAVVTEGASRPFTYGRSHCVVAPVRTAPGQVEALVVVWRVEDDALASDLDHQLVTDYCEEASRAIEERRRRSARCRDAQAVERLTVARGLDRTTAAGLLDVDMQLTSLCARLLPPHSTRLESAIDDLDTVLDELHARSDALRGVGSGVPFRAQLERVVADHGRHLVCAPSLSTSGPLETLVPPERRDDLLAAVARSLDSLADVGSVTQVMIHVEAVPGLVTWTMHHDGDGGGGAGPPPLTTHAISDRARELGGSFDIARRPGHDTTLVWQVPLDHRAPPATRTPSPA